MRSGTGYVWASSPLHRASAGAKLAGLLGCSLLVALSRGALLACAVLLVCALACASHVGARRALAPAWGMRWFLALVLVMNALLHSREDALFELGPVALTLAGAAQGATIAVRVAAIAVLAGLLTATTRPQELVRGVSRALRPLERLGVPVEEAALAVGVTVQFVPTLLREGRQLARAQRLRAGGSASRGMIRRAVGFARLLVPVFVAAFRRADELSVAMEARGYQVAPTDARAERAGRDS